MVAEHYMLRVNLRNGGALRARFVTGLKPALPPGGRGGGKPPHSTATHALSLRHAFLGAAHTTIEQYTDEQGRERVEATV